MTGFIPLLMKGPFSIHGVPDATTNPKGMGFNQLISGLLRLKRV